MPGNAESASGKSDSECASAAGNDTYRAQTTVRAWTTQSFRHHQTPRPRAATPDKPEIASFLAVALQGERYACDKKWKTSAETRPALSVLSSPMHSALAVNGQGKTEDQLDHASQTAPAIGARIDSNSFGQTERLRAAPH
jgi:hypothetical protein